MFPQYSPTMSYHKDTKWSYRVPRDIFCPDPTMLYFFCPDFKYCHVPAELGPLPQFTCNIYSLFPPHLNFFTYKPSSAIYKCTSNFLSQYSEYFYFDGLNWIYPNPIGIVGCHVLDVCGHEEMQYCWVIFSDDKSLNTFGCHSVTHSGRFLNFRILTYICEDNIFLCSF